MLAGTLVFAAQPASRSWRPEAVGARRRGGALRSPAIRLLIVILLGTGTVFGATEVGVTAAAHALGGTSTAGPLLGLWGAGSLLGGMAATQLGGSARDARGLIPLLAALALTHGALILTAGSLVATAVVITLAGATIAPTASSIYAMVDTAAPAGTRTEAYSWLLTASLVGASFGMAGAGTLVERAGASAAFALVGIAGCLAALAAVFGSHRWPNARRHGDALALSGEPGCMQA
jgi:predicted MFS family arabinose efflux permease